MDELTIWDKHRLEGIKRRGANCYWDDIPFHQNPFASGYDAAEGYKHEHQAWADGWNQADREIHHGVMESWSENK